MKRFILVPSIVLFLVAARIAMAEAPPQQDIDLLRSIETRRLRALVDVEMDVAKELHGADYQLITPSGLPMNRDEYLGAIAAKKLHYLVFEPISPVAVRLYQNGAVLRYMTHIEFEWEGVKGHGGGFWHTDVYEKRENRWVAVWSQATAIWQPETKATVPTSAPAASVPGGLPATPAPR